jgi:hypothetical protein
MTPIKCKSFKEKDLPALDDKISQFMESEKVSEVVHVVSFQAPRSSLTAVTLFYKCDKPKRTRKNETIKEEVISNG